MRLSPLASGRVNAMRVPSGEIAGALADATIGIGSWPPSLGTFHRTVPDLVGQSMRLARLRLGDAGLSVGQVMYAANELVGDDLVMASEPEGGTPPGGGSGLGPGEPGSPGCPVSKEETGCRSTERSRS